MFLLKKENKQYLVVFVCCCIMTCGMIGGTNMNGLFYDSMAMALNATKTQTTLHMTVSNLTSGLLTPFAARMYRRYGGKKVVVTGAALYLLAGIIISISSNVYLNTIMGVIKGMGYCLTNFLIITMTMYNWFNKYRGKLIGITLCTSGIYGAIASPIITKTIQIFGFRIAYFLFTVFTVLCLLPYILWCPLKPKDVNMNPYGDNEGESTKVNRIGTADYRPASLLFGLIVVLQIITQSMASVGSHFPSLSASVGYPEKTGSTMVSMAMIGNVVMKLIIGVMVDKMGSYKSIVIMMIVSSISLLTIITTGNSYISEIFALTYGAGYAANTVGFSALISETYTKEDYSKAYSQVNLISNLSNAAFLSIISAFYDRFKEFRQIFLLIVLLQYIGIICIILISKKDFGKRKERINL